MIGWPVAGGKATGHHVMGKPDLPSLTVLRRLAEEQVPPKQHGDDEWWLSVEQWVVPGGPA